MYRSSITSSLSSERSSTKVTSDSKSPAIPSPPRTSWQKPWVVAIVAPSKLATARARLRWRASTSAALPEASRSTSGSVPGSIPSRVARSPRSALAMRSRTRSRSSPVAIRVKVTSRSSSNGIPSAT